MIRANPVRWVSSLGCYVTTLLYCIQPCNAKPVMPRQIFLGIDNFLLHLIFSPWLDNAENTTA